MFTKPILLKIFILCVWFANAFGSCRAHAAPPQRILLEVSPSKTEWDSSPVILDHDFFPEDLNPASLRVSLIEGTGEVPIPTRLQTEGIPPKLTWIAWKHKGIAPRNYRISFDTYSSGKVYVFPEEVPLVGCGEPLAFGRRSEIGHMTGGYNSTFEAVDWDGDGDLDLLGSFSGEPTVATFKGVYYYENLGPQLPGILGFPQRILKDPQPIRVYDWNRDNRSDLCGGGKVHLNQGKNGEFVFSTPIEISGVEAAPWDFMDWDGDGLRDLFVGVSDGTNYYPPAGSWDRAKEPPYTPQGEWRGGKTIGKVLFQKNVGTKQNPQFTPPAPLLIKNTQPLETWGTPFPRWVDWDKEGDMDLIIGTLFEIYLYENTSQTTVPYLEEGVRLSLGEVRQNEPNTIVPFTLHEGIYVRPIPVDWDRDGDLDLLIGQENGFVTFAERIAGNRLKAPVILSQQGPLLDVGCLSTPCVCDWNGDGVADIISGNSYGEVLLFESTPPSPSRCGAREEPFHWKQSSFTRIEANGAPILIQAGPNGSIQGPEEARYGYTNPAVCDWDGDGLLDLLLSDVWGHNNLFYNVGSKHDPQLNNAGPLDVEWGGLPLKPAWIWENPSPKAYINVWRTKPVAIDWNRDGHMDLVTLDHEGYLVFLERFRDARGFLSLLPPQRIFKDPEGTPLHFGEGVAGRAGRGKFDLVDWDRDGDHDLLTYEFDTMKTVGYFRNEASDQTPTFAYQGDLLAPRVILAGHSTTPCAMDFDKDGNLDLLVGCEDGLIYAFHRAFIENDLPVVKVLDRK